MKIVIITGLGFVLRPFKHVNIANHKLKVIGSLKFDILM